MEDCEVGLYSSTPPLQQITTGPKSNRELLAPSPGQLQPLGQVTPPHRPVRMAVVVGTGSTAPFPVPVPVPVSQRPRGRRVVSGSISVTRLWPPTINLLLHSHNSIFSPSAHVRRTYTKSMCSSTHTGSCALHLLGKECHGYTAMMGVSRLVLSPDFGRTNF